MNAQPAPITRKKPSQEGSMKPVEQFTKQFSGALARVIARSGRNAQIIVSLDPSGNLALSPVLDQDYDPNKAGVIWDGRHDHDIPMLCELAAKTSVHAACEAYVNVHLLHLLWQAQVLGQQIAAPELRGVVLVWLGDLLARVQQQLPLRHVQPSWTRTTAGRAMRSE